MNSDHLTLPVMEGRCDELRSSLTAGDGGTVRRAPFIAYDRRGRGGATNSDHTATRMTAKVAGACHIAWTADGLEDVEEGRPSSRQGLRKVVRSEPYRREGNEEPPAAAL